MVLVNLATTKIRNGVMKRYDNPKNQCNEYPSKSGPPTWKNGCHCFTLSLPYSSQNKGINNMIPSTK